MIASTIFYLIQGSTGGGKVSPSIFLLSDAKVRNTASDGFKEIEGEVQKAAQKWDPKF